MCYSAQIEADYRAYVKMFGADIDIKAFIEIYWYRRNDPRLKLPKGMEPAFADPQTDDERRIKQAIDEYKAQESTRLEQELFAQRTRLTEAERALQVKPTKAAANSQRIATDKIAKAKTRLDDLHRAEPEDRDSRIFPAHYAPVMVSENGRRVIKPMRYQCRPAGKPAFYDAKFPGTYNGATTSRAFGRPSSATRTASCWRARSMRT